jgi:hypothetical protein
VQEFNEVALKDTIKSGVLPRKLVSDVFALFCKDSLPNAVDLDMSRE